MDEKKHVISEKNPVGAAVLSALFPGVGFFYIGNFIKGIAYILVFAVLIVLEINSGSAHEHVVFGVMIAGFYIFQIFESFDEAKKFGYMTTEEKRREDQGISLFTSVIILVIGVIFQLANLNIISYRQIAKLWPLALIAVGIKFIYGYIRTKEIDEGEENV